MQEHITFCTTCNMASDIRDLVQLLEFQNDNVANMYNGKQTDVMVMDFSKAFDKVGHKRLIEKINYYGVGGKHDIRWNTHVGNIVKKGN